MRFSKYCICINVYSSGREWANKCHNAQARNRKENKYKFYLVYLTTHEASQRKLYAEEERKQKLGNFLIINSVCTSAFVYLKQDTVHMDELKRNTKKLTICILYSFCN